MSQPVLEPRALRERVVAFADGDQLAVGPDVVAEEGKDCVIRSLYDILRTIGDALSVLPPRSTTAGPTNRWHIVGRWVMADYAIRSTCSGCSILTFDTNCFAAIGSELIVDYEHVSMIVFRSDLLMDNVLFRLRCRSDCAFFTASMCIQLCRHLACSGCRGRTRDRPRSRSFRWPCVGHTIFGVDRRC